MQRLPRMVVTAALGLALVGATPAALATEGEAAGPPRPPSGATAACSGKAENKAFTFEEHGRTEEGACRNGPTNEPLACFPAHPPGPPPEAISACNGKLENDVCSVQFGGQTHDGTCAKGARGQRTSGLQAGAPATSAELASDGVRQAVYWWRRVPRRGTPACAMALRVGSCVIGHCARPSGMWAELQSGRPEEELMAERIAVVTGGTGGLGATISTKLHDRGYVVVLTHSPSNATIHEKLSEFKSRGYHFRSYGVDVSDFDSCQGCVEKIHKEVGPIDILINNAGITRDMTFRKMSKVDWDAVMNTNLSSVFNMTKPVCNGMVDRGWGRIINVSSVNGSKGAFGQTNYAAAKAGMHGFTKALALEVARKGVTVNTISPGYIGTKMVTAIPKEVLDTKIIPQIPVGRLGKPEEVAGLIIYLCSDEAAFVTGANIAINGGQHMQ